MDSLKVRLPNGHVCWLLSATLCAATDAPLAELEHCNEAGELLEEAALLTSYAHMWDGVVRRFSGKLCTWDELELVEGVEATK